jgi:dsDNA-specific endonuclease/ATPase MutS2
MDAKPKRGDRKVSEQQSRPGQFDGVNHQAFSSMSKTALEYLALIPNDNNGSGQIASNREGAERELRRRAMFAAWEIKP